MAKWQKHASGKRTGRKEMTFVESVSTCFKKYADFSGRATRSEYWWFFLFALLLPPAAMMVGDAVSRLSSLALVLPSLAVGARRLHDVDKSAWFLLLWLIPLIGWIVLMAWAAQEGEEPNRFTSVA